MTWSLAAGYFPAQYPGWSHPGYWLVAGFASVLFFASIFVHELGHCWIARRHAVPIRGITLFVFGGIAQTAREAGSPAADLRIAIAGPLTSVVLSGLFTAVAAVTRSVEQERLIHDEVLGAGRRCFLVVDDSRLRGLITLHAIKSVPRDRWMHTRVEEVMTPAKDITTARPEDDLLAARQKMDDIDVAQLPVMSGDVLLGMLSREHVLHYLRIRTELGV